MGKFSQFRSWLKTYLIIVGLLGHFALGFGLWITVSYFQLTPIKIIKKSAEIIGLDESGLLSISKPLPRIENKPLDGNLRVNHPRIILPELAEWNVLGIPPFMANRIALYQQQGILDFDPCSMNNELLPLTACWVSSGSSSTAEQLVKKLRNTRMQPPQSQAVYGNGWEVALAYDLLARYPHINSVDIWTIEEKIERSLSEYLELLDDSSASLWHGRTTLASMAWLCAVVLNPNANSGRSQLIARAQTHFLDVVRAVEITEGWPEGYSYWINNRAFYFVLAASAYLNGLDNASHQARILRLLHRIGLWHIYAVRPDNRVEGFGDEGARVDLKDETRRVIDIIAQATRDPVFATFSRYLEGLHRRQSYYHGFQWGFRLFNDPTIETLPLKNPSLKTFQHILPNAEIFGRNGMNLVYIHSSWNPEETFISFHAGDTFTHHGHYDAGHFTLFKGAPLAVNSSIYGDYTGLNRLNYSLRTVAKNSLLIMRPGEKVKPNRFMKENVADGGQRVIIPTGSAIQDVNDWTYNLTKGAYFAGGKLICFDFIDDVYVYLATDLTEAYNTPIHDEGGNGGKVSKVNRELLYLFEEDMLVVHDRVVSTDPGYTKKWLLHSINRPQLEDTKLLKGTEENGILESRSSTAIITNGNSYLRINRIYPENAVMRLVGGPDYLFYVESDGDDSDLDGRNYREGASFEPWFDVGLWRIEIQPGKPRPEDDFLVTLSPSTGKKRNDRVQTLLLHGMPAKGVATEKSLVIFVSPIAQGRMKVAIPGNQSRLYVLGIPPGLRVHAIGHELDQELSANLSGVLTFELANEMDQIALQW